MNARRRALSAVLVVAMGGAVALPLMVAGAANADNGLDLIAPSGTGTYSGNSYSFSGTADAVDTSDIVVHDGPLATDPVLCTVAYSANWDCDSGWTPSPGSYTLSAWQDTRSDVATFNLLVPVPTIDSTVITIVTGGTLHVSGTTTAPNSDIVYSVGGGGDYCEGGTPYPNGFAWYCDIWPWSLSGDFVIAVRQVVDGVYSLPVNATLHVLDGNLTISTDNGREWDGAAGVVSGRTIDSSTPIDVTLDGTAVAGCTGIVPTGVDWNCNTTIPDPGAHQYLATQGSTSVAADISVTVPVPVVDQAPAFVDVADSSLTFTGTVTAPNSTWDVSIDGGSYCTSGPTFSAGAPYSCVIDTTTNSFTPGMHSVTVTQHSGGLDASVDLTMTTIVPGITVDNPGTIVWDAGNGFQPSGTAEDTSTPIDLQLDGFPLTGCQGVVPAADSTWQCPTGLMFPNAGQHTLTAIQGGTNSSADENFEILIPAPEFPYVYSLEEGTTYSFGGAVNFDDGTVHVEIVETGDWCEVDVNTVTGTWGACEIDFTGYALATYTVEYWQYTEGADGVQASQYFEVVPAGGYPINEPTLSCSFAPGAVSLDVSGEGTGVALYGPITQGGAEPMTPDLQGHCNGNSGTPVTEIDSWGPQIACDEPCSPSGLVPGVYDVYYWTGGGEGDSFDYFFTVPVAPSIDTVTRSGNTLTAAGSALGSHPVRLVNGGATLCQTTSDAAGQWSCTFAASTRTSARAVQVDPGSGAVSPLSPTITLPTRLATTGTATPTPVAWVLDFGDDDEVAPGDTITVGSSGLPAGSHVTIELHSQVVQLLDIVTDDATNAFDVVIPDDAEPGAHELEFTATTPDAQVAIESHPITVIAAAVPTDETTTSGGDSQDPTSGSGGASGARNEPAAPSALSASLATFADIAQHPFVLLTAGGLGLALLFLVAIPTELLNSTLSSNQNRLGRGFRVIETTFDRVTAWFIRVTRSRALAAAIVIVLVSIIFGFVDPAFGFDLTSLRLVLSLSIAFFVLSYVTAWITGAVLRRTARAESVIVIQPAIILFAIVGVVLARLLDFAPGFLVGLVIGLHLVHAGRRAAATSVLIQFGLILGLAAASWLAYSILAAQGAPDDFWGALLGDTLAAVTAEGLMAIFVAAFPLRFLEGRDLWEHSKALWFGTFFVIAFAFALLVLPTALSGTDGDDIGAWVIVFAAFGVVSFALWAVFAALDRRERARGAITERERADA